MSNFNRYSSDFRYQAVMNLMNDINKENDKDIADSLDVLLGMTKGVCFCNAHSWSECCCGAWDDDNV